MSAEYGEYVFLFRDSKVLGVYKYEDINLNIRFIATLDATWGNASKYSYQIMANNEAIVSYGGYRDKSKISASMLQYCIANNIIEERYDE
jgi:hypothetical protein